MFDQMQAMMRDAQEKQEAWELANPPRYSRDDRAEIAPRVDDLGYCRDGRLASIAGRAVRVLEIHTDGERWIYRVESLLRPHQATDEFIFLAVDEADLEPFEEGDQ